MSGLISAEMPHLTSGNFESSLASDNVLTHYFNDFLSLPSFSVNLLYNQETGLFEVVNGAAHFLSSKSQILSDLPVLMKTPPAHHRYTVLSLDREQGIQWLKQERLAFFLQSDFYHQYRLAKLLLQWDPNFCSQRNSSSQLTFPVSKFNNCPQLFTENTNALTLPHSQESISAKQGVLSLGQNKKTQKCHNSQRLLTVSVDMRANNRLRERVCETPDSHENHLELLAFKVVNKVIGEAVNVVKQADTSHCVTEFQHQTNCSSTTYQDVLRDTEQTENMKLDEKTRTIGSKITNQKHGLGVGWHGSCSRVCNKPGLDEFKQFLRGTAGENLLNLWMDIERLQAAQHSKRTNRYLALMMNRYLVSSSPSRLNEVLLSTLELNTSLCWTQQKLLSVLPSITERLRCYWAPRFWSSQYVQDVSPCEEPWAGGSYCRPRSGVQGCHGSSPQDHPYSCVSQTPSAIHTQLLYSRPQLFCGGAETLLQALSAESQSGLYFTHFCEQSGNQLWVNAVYFWTDLLQYHELFCQDGLDSYRVQREAQLLYSTYVSSSARRSINVAAGVQREVYDTLYSQLRPGYVELFAAVQREVYDRLRPAFEELFDDVEDHALNILLEPWTLLLHRDRESLQQVSLQDEVRCVDYWELQNLKESERRPGQLLSSGLHPSTDSSEGSQLHESWSSVSPGYHGRRLSSLLQQPREIEHFMSFLQKQDASIHLMCWLELEQYKKTPQENEDIREEWSSQIVAKYLNEKYYFGSDSPATTEQQNYLVRRAGGLERLKSASLSDPVILEVQDIIRKHMEETWLPLFLSAEEFTERQKHEQKLQTADRLSHNIYSRRRARREAWKVQGRWMNSSTELMLFRRVLLDPTTCEQFQLFVSLKGDLLQNDVRFWVEVQKYKDLCHSHSDEATIQQKISIIISCFINSSVPPTLQIDIPPDQAQRILEKRHELGPYIFREAQASVFNELLRFWPEFNELRRMVPEEQLFPLLQKKRVKHITRAWKQRREEEEEEEENKRRAQEELERESSCRQEEADEEQEGMRENQSRTHSREAQTPSQPLMWSYSKYMAGLKKEEMLLGRQSQLSSSSSTESDLSTDSFRSASSKHGPSRTDGTKNRSDSSKNQRLQNKMRPKWKN